MQLYKIADEIEVILASEVDHETGEITDETIAKLDSLEMERDAKALAVAAYLKGELAEGEAVEREVVNLKQRATGHKNRAKRLRDYLAMNLPKDCEPISDARSRIAWRKNPPKVVIHEDHLVPADYQRVIPESREPDKKKIADALKGGEHLTFAELERSQRLEVK